MRRALKRVKNTAPQVGLSPLDRQENVRDAFCAELEAVRGRQILLIDDVFTTGATMLAAAECTAFSWSNGRVCLLFGTHHLVVG